MTAVLPEESPDITNYWQYFQLHRDPFAMHTDKALVFIPNQWEEILDLLQYISHYKNQLMVVTGDNGAGKTTLLELLLSQMGETVHLGRIHAETSFDVSRLIEWVGDVFNVPWHPEQTLEQMLDEELTALQQKDRPCLLVIDNAHLLPFETLEALLYLIGQQSEHQMNCHVLLLAEPGLLQTLQRLLEPEEENLLHMIQLTPLTIDETSLYLGHRLAVAGWQEDFPLTDEIITRIYRLSEGNPVRINRIARRALLDMLTQDRQDKTGSFFKRYANKLIGCGVLLVVLIMGASWLVHNAQTPKLPATISLNGQALNPEVAADGSIPLPLPQALKSPVSAPSSAAVDASSTVPVTTMPSANTKEVLPVVAPIILSDKGVQEPTPAIMPTPVSPALAVTPLPAMKAPAVTESVAAPVKALAAPSAVATTVSTTAIDDAVATSMPSAATSPKTPLVKEPSVIATAKVVSADKTIKVETISKVAKSEAVVKSAKPQAIDAYGLELLNITSLRELSVLLKQCPGLKAHLTIIHGKVKSIHVFYGHYPTLKAASKALATLPSDLTTQKLWPAQMSTKVAKVKKSVLAVKEAN